MLGDFIVISKLAINLILFDIVTLFIHHISNILGCNFNLQMDINLIWLKGWVKSLGSVHRDFQEEVLESGVWVFR